MLQTNGPYRRWRPLIAPPRGPFVAPVNPFGCRHFTVLQIYIARYRIVIEPKERNNNDDA